MTPCMKDLLYNACKGWAWMVATWDLCSREVESQSLGLAGYLDE